MLLVTLHGGSNIPAYDDGRKLICSNVLQGTPAGVSELRGISQVTGELLWVAAAGKSESALLCYASAGRKASIPRYRFIHEVVGYPSPSAMVPDYPLANSLLHPFDFAFDSDGCCYVSNQDSDVVARLSVSADHKTASPTKLAPALPPGTFLQGTFIACSCGNLPGVGITTTEVPLDAGLAVEIQDGKVTHSVRGVVWANHFLYVADEPAQVVKVYDPNGRYLAKSCVIAPAGNVPVFTPVHLTFRDGVLYAPSGNTIFWAKLDPQRPTDFVFRSVTWPRDLDPSKKGPIQGAAGLAWGVEGEAYLADRTAKQVWKLSGLAGGNVASLDYFIDHLHDNPEFVLYPPR